MPCLLISKFDAAVGGRQQSRTGLDSNLEEVREEERSDWKTGGQREDIHREEHTRDERWTAGIRG